MKLVVCVSEEMGIMFNQRRQSSDRKVVQDVLDMAGDAKLFAHSYSGKLFAEHPQVILTDDYLAQAGPDDFCFFEKGTLQADQVSSVILYNWNRSYPCDLFLSDIIDIGLFEKTDECEFQGNSHDKITRQIFERA